MYDRSICTRPRRRTRADAAALEQALGVVETLGADILAHGRLALAEGRQDDTTKEILTVRLPGAARVAEGDRLPLRADQEALHLFDSDTGQRLADV